jgi:hypothetical protein
VASRARSRRGVGGQLQHHGLHRVAGQAGEAGQVEVLPDGLPAAVGFAAEGEEAAAGHHRDAVESTVPPGVATAGTSLWRARAGTQPRLTSTRISLPSICSGVMTW